MAHRLKITQRPSPNFGPRREYARPNLIVLHYTAMESSEAALERLCSEEFEVSAHYLISRKGEIIQMVAEESRAWHAGAGIWGKCKDINSNSIGVELDNDGKSPYPAPQMASLEALLPEIMRRWDIPFSRIIGHSDMAPERKTDPGRRFDWRRLALSDLAVWQQTGAIALEISLTEWCEQAARFGYDAISTDNADVYLTAFRDRFRAGHRGALDVEDMRIIQNLAQRFPVDDPLTNA